MAKEHHEQPWAGLLLQTDVNNLVPAHLHFSSHGSVFFYVLNFLFYKQLLYQDTAL